MPDLSILGTPKYVMIKLSLSGIIRIEVFIETPIGMEGLRSITIVHLIGLHGYWGHMGHWNCLQG